MIEVNSISKKFGDITALKDVTMPVKGGEIFGIVGPDGAGKSTLLRIMAGILAFDSGTVSINNISVNDNIYQIKENLAYMPQRFGLYEDLTVEENIYFFGKLFGVSKKNIKLRTVELYEFSRLEPFKKRLAGNLSGGMKQKLGLACCLIHRPEVILLDEPTNGVDPVSRREFWKILYGLLGEGVTIIVSTSYLDEAERCNRIAFMHKGSIVITGSPDEIKSSMTKTLLEIKTEQKWEAETLLRQSKKYSSVFREGSHLKIFTGNPVKEKKNIALYLNKNNVSLQSINKKTPTLENCFMEVISNEESHEENH